MIAGVDEKSDFFLLRDVMEKIGFSKDEIGAVFVLLAAILHLGNIVIVVKNEEECSTEDQDSLQYCANLLGISKESLKYWLCNKQIVTAHEKLIKPLTVLQVCY